MDGPIRPLFLLADSQLLFWRDGGRLFLERVREALGDCPDPRAAYLGASNGDVPEFYEIFVAAMDGIGVRRTRHVPSAPSEADLAFLDEADVVLLAGGDTARGLRVFEETGLRDRILARYAGGAVLLGVSAGAAQLGLDGLRLVPAWVGAHDEPDWAALTATVTARQGQERGLGLPTGGGALVHDDLTVEPVRKAAVEIAVEEGVVRRALLVPGEARGPVVAAHDAS